MQASESDKASDFTSESIPKRQLSKASGVAVDTQFHPHKRIRFVDPKEDSLAARNRQRTNSKNRRQREDSKATFQTQETVGDHQQSLNVFQDVKHMDSNVSKDITLDDQVEDLKNTAMQASPEADKDQIVLLQDDDIGQNKATKDPKLEGNQDIQTRQSPDKGMEKEVAELAIVEQTIPPAENVSNLPDHAQQERLEVEVRPEKNIKEAKSLHQSSIAASPDQVESRAEYEDKPRDPNFINDHPAQFEKLNEKELQLVQPDLAATTPPSGKIDAEKELSQESRQIAPENGGGLEDLHTDLQVELSGAGQFENAKGGDDPDSEPGTATHKSDSSVQKPDMKSQISQDTAYNRNKSLILQDFAPNDQSQSDADTARHEIHPKAEIASHRDVVSGTDSDQESDFRPPDIKQLVGKEVNDEDPGQNFIGNTNRTISEAGSSQENIQDTKIQPDDDELRTGLEAPEKQLTAEANAMDDPTSEIFEQAETSYQIGMDRHDVSDVLQNETLPTDIAERQKAMGEMLGNHGAPENLSEVGIRPMVTGVTEEIHNERVPRLDDNTSNLGENCVTNENVRDHNYVSATELPDSRAVSALSHISALTQEVVNAKGFQTDVEDNQSNLKTEFAYDQPKMACSVNTDDKSFATLENETEMTDIETSVLMNGENQARDFVSTTLDLILGRGDHSHKPTPNDTNSSILREAQEMEPVKEEDLVEERKDEPVFEKQTTAVKLQKINTISAASYINDLLLGVNSSPLPRRTDIKEEENTIDDQNIVAADLNHSRNTFEPIRSTTEDQARPLHEINNQRESGENSRMKFNHTGDAITSAVDVKEISQQEQEEVNQHNDSRRTQVEHVLQEYSSDREEVKQVNDEEINKTTTHPLYVVQQSSEQGQNENQSDDLAENAAEKVLTFIIAEVEDEVTDQTEREIEAMVDEFMNLVSAGELKIEAFIVQELWREACSSSEKDWEARCNEKASERAECHCIDLVLNEAIDQIANDIQELAEQERASQNFAENTNLMGEEKDTAQYVPEDGNSTHSQMGQNDNISEKSDHLNDEHRCTAQSFEKEEETLIAALQENVIALQKQVEDSVIQSEIADQTSAIEDELKYFMTDNMVMRLTNCVIEELLLEEVKVEDDRVTKFSAIQVSEACEDLCVSETLKSLSQLEEDRVADIVAEQVLEKIERSLYQHLVDVSVMRSDQIAQPLINEPVPEKPILYQQPLHSPKVDKDYKNFHPNLTSINRRTFKIPTSLSPSPKSKKTRSRAAKRSRTPFESPHVSLGNSRLEDFLDLGRFEKNLFTGKKMTLKDQLVFRIYTRELLELVKNSVDRQISTKQNQLEYHLRKKRCNSRTPPHASAIMDYAIRTASPRERQRLDEILNAHPHTPLNEILENELLRRGSDPRPLFEHDFSAAQPNCLNITISQDPDNIPMSYGVNPPFLDMNTIQKDNSLGSVEPFPLFEEKNSAKTNSLALPESVEIPNTPKLSNSSHDSASIQHEIFYIPAESIPNPPELISESIPIPDVVFDQPVYQSLAPEDSELLYKDQSKQFRHKFKRNQLLTAEQLKSLRAHKKNLNGKVSPVRSIQFNPNQITGYFKHLPVRMKEFDYYRGVRAMKPLRGQKTHTLSFSEKTSPNRSPQPSPQHLFFDKAGNSFSSAAQQPGTQNYDQRVQNHTPNSFFYPPNSAASAQNDQGGFEPPMFYDLKGPNDPESNFEHNTPLYNQADPRIYYPNQEHVKSNTESEQYLQHPIYAGSFNQPLMNQNELNQNANLRSVTPAMLHNGRQKKILYSKGLKIRKIRNNFSNTRSSLRSTEEPRNLEYTRKGASQCQTPKRSPIMVIDSARNYAGNDNVERAVPKSRISPIPRNTTPFSSINDNLRSSIGDPYAEKVYLVDGDQKLAIGQKRNVSHIRQRKREAIMGAVSAQTSPKLGPLVGTIGADVKTYKKARISKPKRIYY